MAICGAQIVGCELGLTKIEGGEKFSPSLVKIQALRFDFQSTSLSQASQYSLRGKPLFEV